MNSRITYTIVSKAMSSEEAKKEYDYTVGNAAKEVSSEGNFSSLRVTRETWNGNAWGLDECFDKENR
jgi:hypothetical protein